MSVYYTEDEFPGKAKSKHSAFLDDDELRDFDNKFFGIDAEEAQYIQPINRVLLELSYETYEMVGYDMDSLKGANIATYIADIGPDWEQWRGYQENPEVWLRSCSTHGVLNVNRMCHLFGTVGPSYQLDTACSTSLVSANCLEKMLRQHDERGVTEGISMGLQNILSPFAFVGLSAAGMLGKGGRSLTFDRSANGYNRGEGCGGLFLRSGSSVKDVQDRIACYVSGFINQDGRSASLTAPNGPSQQECMRASLRLAGITTDKVNMNENHGTGTALGDPIECGSIRAVFRGRGQRGIPVTSGKSHMGHLEAGAGSVGLIKTIVSLINNCSPPNCHLLNLNPHIEFDGFPGMFPVEQLDLGADHAVGSMNSFGFGGTNSRGDLWARCLKGYRETGGRKMALERLDWVTVPCARCMGPMCWLCGMALTESSPAGKHKCGAIRELLQSYEYCSDCYAGGYSFGGPDERSADALGSSVGIVGSWSNFSMVDEMSLQPDGAYEFEFALGDTCTEQFYFVLERNLDKAIYPATAKASPTARVEGPGVHVESKSWLVNGRQDGMPTGTVYKIRFHWQPGGQMSVSWVSTSSRVSALDFEPAYSIVGSFTAWEPVAMERSPTDPNLWLFTAAIERKQEQFLFMRNGDQEQLIYPLDEDTVDTLVPVMGPDGGGVGKMWLVEAAQGETMEVRLRVKDGDIAVTATTEAMGEKTWQSMNRPVRDAFFVLGSWNRLLEPMEEDLTESGIYKLRFVLGGGPNRQAKELSQAVTKAETFQIVVNKSSVMRMYPMTEKAPPGLGLVCGPDAKDEGRRWEVLGRLGQTMEITLELGAEDQTQVVTCLPAPPDPAITAE
jgi:hypothetical protein